MLTKQRYCQRKQFSLKLTLLIYSIFPCYEAVGATLFTNLDNLVKLVSSDWQFEVETFLEQERQNWEEIAEKILVSKPDTSSSLGLLVANSVEDRDRSNAENSPLSIRSVVETFKQLNLKSDLKNAKASTVPRLPQVAYSDIDKGVYVFEPTSTVREQSTNSILFDEDNFVSKASFGQVRSIGSSGFSIAVPNSTPSVGMSSLPQPSGGLSMKSVHLSAPSLNAQLSVLPQDRFSTFIGQLSTDANVNNVLNTLNTFGGLKVNVGFRLFPTVAVPNQLDLRADAIQTSDLIRSNLAMISPLQSQIQQQVSRDVQKSYGRQINIQRSTYERATSRQKDYQHRQKESLEQRKERQQQQIERHKERQAKLKERFEEQLQDQLQKYKDRQRKLN